MKNWRVFLLILMVFASFLAIGYKAYPYGREAVEVVYFSDTSPARGVLEQGQVISHVNGQAVQGVEGWNGLTSGIADQTVTLTVDGKLVELEVGDSLGIDVTDISRNNLNLGLDLRGGTRIILKPKENATKEVIDDVISTLQTRANLYGLREMNFIPVREAGGDYLVLIEVAGINRNIVDDLLSTQGKFEAKISKPIQLVGGSGEFQVGQDRLTVTVSDSDVVELDGMELAPGSNFTVNGIDFEYVNNTQNTLLFMGKAYDGDDVELVFTDPQRSGVVPTPSGYNFYFTVSVSTEGAQRFADITSGMGSHIDLDSGQRYLDGVLLLYLDDQLVSDLRISEDLGGKLVQTPQVTGSREEQEDAIQEKLRLQTILRSGALPTSLEVASVSVISPALGGDFFQSTLLAGLFAAGMVIVVVFVRYRNFRVAIPMVLVGLSEVVIILGIAAINDSLIWGAVLVISFIMIATAWWKKHEVDLVAWVAVLLIPLLGMTSWTIDLPAIGGIIAAIGTGVDHQIIIADETLSRKKTERKVYSIKDRIGRAFFIIFGAAATSIGAMVPLMTIGIGFLRGFAITTIVGVLVGVMITRPAYARIIEILHKE